MQNESLIDKLIREKTNRPAEDVYGGVSTWWKQTFGSDIPTKNLGASDFERSVGWEHSRSFDVGLDPNSDRGRQLVSYLQQNGIPFSAFTGPVKSGGRIVSTGPHIHVGPPSQRIGSEPAGDSLIDRLLAQKEQAIPQRREPTAAERRGAYGSRAYAAVYPEKNPELNQRLTKLAHDIDWHFGYGVLMAMPNLPQEKQAEIAKLATEYAAADVEKKKRRQVITKSPAWQLLNQQRVGVVEGKDIEARTPPEVDAAQRAKFAAGANPLLKLPNIVRLVAEPMISGAGGLMEAAAGLAPVASPAVEILAQVTRRPSPGKAISEFLKPRAKEARQMAAESQDVSGRGGLTRLGQGVGAGVIEYAPVMAVPVAGLESVMARIGAMALSGGLYSGAQGVGRKESGEQLLKTTGAGAATFGLFGVPLPGKNVLTKGLSNLVITGGGATLINRATGQPWDEAATHGLVLTLLRSPELIGRVKVRDEATGTERPATIREVRGLLPAARFEVETNVPVPEAGGRKPYYRSPQGATEGAVQTGRVFQQEQGQQDLFGAIRPGVTAGRTDLPGMFPPTQTFEEFAAMRGLDYNDPRLVPLHNIEPRLRALYNSYLESLKRGGGRGQGTVTETTPGTQVLDYGNFIQSFFGLLQHLGIDPRRLKTEPLLRDKTVAAFNELVNEQADRVRTMAATYSFDPQQMLFPVPGPVGERIPTYGTEPVKPVEPALTEAGLSQQYPGVMRMSEETARVNLKTLQDLKKSPTWEKLKPAQKEAIEAQIKRLEEQGVGALPEPATEEQLRGMRGEKQTREAQILRDAQNKYRQSIGLPPLRDVSRETPEARAQRIFDEHVAENKTFGGRVRDFLKSEKGELDIDELRKLFVKDTDVQQLGNVDRKPNKRPEALKAADAYVREQRAEQEYFENLSRVLERERSAESGVIELKDVDFKEKVKNFFEDETGSLDLNEVRKGLQKIGDFSSEFGRTLRFSFKSPRVEEPVYIDLMILPDGTAYPEFHRMKKGLMGQNAERMFSFHGKERIPIGVDTVLALRSILREDFPEVKRIDFNRMGSTGGVFDRHVNLPVAGRAEPTTQKSTSSGMSPEETLFRQDIEKRLATARQRIEDFLADEEGSFKPDELKKRINELIEKFPNATDAEIRTMLRNPSREVGVETRGIGLDPREAVRAADDLTKEGFTIERGKERDFSWTDLRRSPLSNLQFTGFFERFGGPVGKKISDAFRNTQVQTEQLFGNWQKQVEQITSLLDQAKGTVKKDEFYKQFIDLVEKPFSDSGRFATKAADTPLGHALRRYDELTETWRQYIIDSRRSLGIETPENWGITDRGYFRHVFLGDIKLYKNGEWFGTAQTYAQAQKMFLEARKADPTATIHAKARNAFEASRLPWLKFTPRVWAQINQLLGGTKADYINLSATDFLNDIKGIRTNVRQKHLGALFKREGFENYSKDLVSVLDAHAMQLARSQELTKLNYELTPLVERLRLEGKPRLAVQAERLLADLWGTPSEGEMLVGELIRNTPVLRNYVAQPDLAYRNLAARLTSAQQFLRLDFNVRSSIVNGFDSLATLWPEVTSREYAELFARATKPSTWKRMRELGIVHGATKIESGTVVTGKKSKIPRPFRAASDFNRIIGYLHGEQVGQRMGLDAEATHRLGLEWTKRVEYDNSRWNVAPLLRGPTSRILGQFKGYPLKQLEHIGALAKRREGEGGGARYQRLAKFATSRAVLGGTKAALSPLRVGLGVGGYELVVAISNQLQEHGVKKDEADKLAQAVYYGAPSLMGQDLSASVALMDDFYGRTPEEKIVNFVGGPTLGGALGAYKSQSFEQLASKTTPYLRGVSIAREMYDRGGTSTIPAGRDERIELTPFESIMRIIGFTPVKQSVHYEKGGSVKQQLMGELKERLRKGDQSALEEANKLKREGRLEAADVTEIRKSLFKSDLVQKFKKLRLAEAEKRYEELSPEEQQEVRQILMEKRRNKKIYQSPE